jgi:preprotein translocase subunit SecG
MLFFAIIIIIAAVILGLIVLIQNPKGGGIAGSLGGVSNQLIGVKQTTDILEKGTWIFAGLVGILCMLSPAFIPKKSSSKSVINEIQGKAPAQAAPPSSQMPNTQQPAQQPTP